jgi:hypothetical protein
MNHAKLLLLSVPAFGAGCISHQDTTYRDVPRAPVEFENEAAGRIFYEVLSKIRPAQAAELRTDISVPLIFDSRHCEVTGPNIAFNDAVARCDTNRDGRITELEAKIFAQNSSK